MTVRNPHRPRWLGVWLRCKWSSFVHLMRAEIAGCARPDPDFARLRWAARHACKRLRQERDKARAEAFDLAIKVLSMEEGAAKFKEKLKSLEGLDDATLARVVRRVIREWRELS